MLFKRKTPPDWRETLRVAVWPRRSWARSTRYLAKRVLRLTASPHAIAAGIAAGVFASFTPYMGFHFVISFAIAYLIAGNFIASATGTFFGNPLTFPFIWASTLSTGNFILTGSVAGDPDAPGLERLREISLWDLGYDGIVELLDSVWEPLIKPMTIGAIPLGIGIGLIFYFMTRWAAISFQASRRRMLAEKARQLKAEALEKVDTLTEAKKITAADLSNN